MSNGFTEPTVDELEGALLPTDEDPLDDAEEIAAIEADEDLEADDLLVTDEPHLVLGKSWAFDFATSRFVPGLRGGPLATWGLTTLRGWAEKCLRTERGVYPIYDSQYGIEGVNALIGVQYREALDGDLEERIRDALTFHPRVTDIEDFEAEFDEEYESLYVSFRVVTDEQEPLDIQSFPLVGG